MAIGNLALGSGCSWGTNKLNIPTNSYAISTGSPVFGADGSYTVSYCFKCNSYDMRDGYYSILLDIQNILKIRYYYAYGNVTLQINVAYNQYGSADNLTKNITNQIDNQVIDIVRTVSDVKIYINGQLALTTTRSGNILTPTTKLALACEADGSGTVITQGQCNLDVYAINIYNRALDPSEIETNFNTYNSRFNLGL